MSWIVFSTYFKLKQFGKSVYTCCIVFVHNTGSNNLSRRPGYLSVSLFTFDAQTTGGISTKFGMGVLLVHESNLGEMFWVDPRGGGGRILEKHNPMAKLSPYGPGRRAESFCSTFCGTFCATFKWKPKISKKIHRCFLGKIVCFSLGQAKRGRWTGWPSIGL